MVNCRCTLSNIIYCAPALYADWHFLVLTDRMHKKGTSVKEAGEIYMDTGLILKVAGVGLIVSVLYQVLSKTGRDEMAMLVSVTGIVIVLLMLVGEIATLLNTIKALFGL